MKQKYTLEEATEKLEHYCALEDRHNKQIYRKLANWGIYGDASDEIVSHLISENFLNEERFAHSFVRGKVKIKRWGKVKLKMELKAKGISEYSISKALSSIDDELYLQNLEKECRSKVSQIKGSINNYKDRVKIFRFLLQKGYEMEEINRVFDRIR